jgi:hypothetical protein
MAGGLGHFNLVQNRGKKGAVVETTCVNILLVIYLVQIQASRTFFMLTLSI